ncbi:DUF2569 family protein [Brevibacillus migulae]|uniref:DUF2569 family protein n=1 Tax=Brevibacillus migulae TaxID=1644114 RepID=UPI00106E7CFB|nr:DUF2569 family protein [Brevibacillus migulae]
MDGDHMDVSDDSIKTRDYNLIGGWLILFGLSLLFSILSSIGYIKSTALLLIFGELLKYKSEHSLYVREMMIYESILHLVNISFIISIIINWVKRKRKMKKIAIYYILFAIFFALSELVYSIIIDLISVNYLLSTLFQVILMTIWIIYFARSKRVNGTFVN